MEAQKAAAAAAAAAAERTAAGIYSMDIVFFFSIASFLTILLQVIEVHNFLMMKFLVGKRPISTKLDLIFPIPPSFNFSTKIQDQMLNLFLRSSRILGEIQ